MNVKVEVEKHEPWRRVLTVEVPADEAAREYDLIAKKVAKSVNLPGFRKGKVPAQVVRKSFKAELDKEFVETVVPKAFGAALEETGIDPVTEPKFEDLSFGDERPLSFKADFDARPDLEPTGYEGVAVTKEIPEVQDEQIDKVAEDFRASRSELEEVDRPAIEGDHVVVDYYAIDDQDAKIEGREVNDYVVEVGAGTVVEQFEAAVRGSKAGDFAIAEVPYPEDYDDAELAGKTARYRLMIRKVQEKRLPELTDELVETTTDVKTVEELRGKIREELEREADRFATNKLEQEILEKVLDANPFEAPESLVEGLLEDFVHQQKHEMQRAGQDPESMETEAVKQQNRPGAERQVQRMLMLDAIAQKQDIAVEQKELQDRVLAMSQAYGVDPRQMIEQFGGDRFLRRISREIRDKKVLAFLVESAEITEKQVSADTPV